MAKLAGADNFNKAMEYQFDARQLSKNLKNAEMWDYSIPWLDVKNYTLVTV